MMWADMSNGMSQYFGAMSQNFEKRFGVYNTLFALQKVLPLQVLQSA